MSRAGLIFLSQLIFVCFVSCNQHNDSVTDWTENEITLLTDSANEKPLARYNDDNCIVLIVRDNTDSLKVKKLTLLPGKSVTVDTLIITRASEYRSLRYPYKYQISDSEVVSIFLQKIIHPSSNWQGQTPGIQEVKRVYKRVDRH